MNGMAFFEESSCGNLYWGYKMKKAIGLALLSMLCISFNATAQAKMNFYWISHGSEGDPIWVYAVNGAKAAGTALNVNVKSSFHHNDLALQVEAIKSAIAANADGIATTSPTPGALKPLVDLAKSKGIPLIIFNSDDKASGRLAYVGANLYQAGVQWAQYLVDKKLVKKGDKVWLPVEVPGAQYQVDETAGIASIFDPLGIKYEVFNAGGDPSGSIQNMADYLIGHGNEIAAMIGLGDMVMGNVKRVWSSVNWKAGKIPVVGWGNSIETAQATKEGYVLAATWQYPDSLGFVPITMLYMAKKGMLLGYDITTLAMYDKTNIESYIKMMAKK